MTGYYRKFVKGYGQLAAPFTALSRKDASHCNSATQEAFERLKTAVSSPPVLALPDFSKPFLIECDASDQGLGAVLMLEGRPIAYHSQALRGKTLHLST